MPMAILAIVVIGALVAGGFLVGYEETRIGRAVLEQEQAFRAADGGVRRVIAEWAPGTFAELRVGDSASLRRQWDGNVRFEGSVRRLGERIFMIRVLGYGETGTAAQQVGMFVRTVPNVELPRAAVTVEHEFTGDPGLIDSQETVPDGWPGCPTRDSAAASVARTDSAGEPERAAARFRAGVTKSAFGASLIPWPSASGEECQEADPLNWGDPLDPNGPCGSYYPIVSLRGAAETPVEIAGGRGQGVVVVDGDLVLSGGFVFAGFLVVRGTLSARGNGVRIMGGVLAGNVDFSGTVRGPVVMWSKCALSRALDASSRAEPLVLRPWFKVF